MFKITPLFSGSKGNSSLIEYGDEKILLDLGYGFKSIVSALQSLGIDPEQISAVIITHEHGDHISALPNWAKRYDTAIYAPKALKEWLSAKVCKDVIGVDGSFVIGKIGVDVYECSHDAQCCYGYRFTAADDCFASVTDTGCYTEKLVEFLSPCRTIQLESNHDVDMLAEGPYSYALKRRILSDFGHLSNEQAVNVLERLIGSCVKNVILAHLSENNNTKELAFSAVINMYAKHGIVEGKDIKIFVAEQRGTGGSVE